MKRTSITIMLALTIIWALVACADKNESNEDDTNNEDSVENEESQSAESDSVGEDEDDVDLTTLLETIWTYVKKVDSTFSLNEPFFLLPHDSFRVVWIPLCNGTNQKPIPSITQRFSALQ